MDWTTIVLSLISALATGLLVAPVTAWLTWKKGSFEIRRQERADAIAEWEKISTNRAIEVNQLRTEMTSLRVEHETCLQGQARNTLKIEVLETEIRFIRGTQEQEESSCWFISSFEGKICDCGGCITPMLGYRPTQLISKEVDILIPEELRELHHQGMEHAVKFGVIRNSAIEGHALNANGEKVPIVILLRIIRWKDDKAIRAEFFPLKNGVLDHSEELH